MDNITYTQDILINVNILYVKHSKVDKRCRLSSANKLCFTIYNVCAKNARRIANVAKNNNHNHITFINIIYIYVLNG